MIFYFFLLFISGCVLLSILIRRLRSSAKTTPTIRIENTRRIRPPLRPSPPHPSWSTLIDPSLDQVVPGYTL
ncbi:hypothetical protein BY458DRAFT_528430 [Sporodiniella umbellata]|nr:hypothetical protein BY458DRAFT_528430 [Sporodiniella umbellata]